MHKTINVLLNLFANVNEVSSFNSLFSSGSVTIVLGIPSLQIGVFSGILVGLIVALLHNKYREISLPEAFSFFGGVRFIPIISTFVAIILGFVLFLIWPSVEYGIFQLSLLVADSGLIGTFLFATIKRLLIPFGLHHVFYLPFWQTSLGWEGYFLYPMLTAAAYVMESQIAYGYFRSLYLAGIAFVSLVFAKFNIHFYIQDSLMI